MKRQVKGVVAWCAVWAVGVALHSPVTRGQNTATSNAVVVERGTFRLHKFEQAIGTETYSIVKDGNGLAVKVDFKFTDRGTDVPLTASFKSKNDLTPIAFEIKGKNSRLSTIDRAVEVNGEQIRVRDREEWKEGDTPQQFFTVAGYAPVTREAVEAGQDQISHIPYILQMMAPPFPAGTKRVARLEALSEIDLESDGAKNVIAFLKEHHTVVDPTLVIYEMGTASTEKPFSTFEPGAAKVAPELAQALFDVGPPGENAELQKKLFEKYVALVGKLHAAGVPVVVGTDQTVPGHSVHREIELYAMAGFTPMEAIQAATIVSARAMGMEKELGTIEAGKRADLILVKGNPLEDIHAIRSVEFVMMGGKMFKTGPLWESVGFLP